MIFDVQQMKDCHIAFVAEVYNENIDILHGAEISVSEWRECLLNDSDPDEINFIITANGQNAAWLKLNGLGSDKMYISMLVVTRKYQRMGVGSFAIHFAESFVNYNNKHIIMVKTTGDNTVAIKFYRKLGFSIVKNIEYAVGDGVLREGMLFEKEI